MDSNQLLKVGVTGNALCLGGAVFYAKIRKDGRIFISKLTLLLLKKEKPNISRRMMEITVESAQRAQLEDDR